MVATNQTNPLKSSQPLPEYALPMATAIAGGIVGQMVSKNGFVKGAIVGGVLAIGFKIFLKSDWFAAGFRK